MEGRLVVACVCGRQEFYAFPHWEMATPGNNHCCRCGTFLRHHFADEECPYKDRQKK